MRVKGSTIRMRKRAFFLSSVIVLLFFAVLVVRLFFLQIISGTDLSKLATQQQLASTKLTPRRGCIYDRNMAPLALSASVWNVVLEPTYIKSDDMKNVISDGLSEILDIPREKVYNNFKKSSCYVIVKKKVDNDIKNRIIDFKSKNNITNGIRLIEDYKRYYPEGTLASTVLGFAGSDMQGLSGIESYYDKTLKGEIGKLVSAKNAMGTDMPYDYEHRVPPVDGHNVVLTIDSTIQKIVENRLEKVIAEDDVRNRAACIAMDPYTGEILALAVKEDFDPNNPFELCRKSDIEVLNNTPEEEKQKVKNELLSQQWRNKIINDNYYPGSVFKQIVAAMGYELGLIPDNYSFTCTGGFKVSNVKKPLRCHKRSGHGTLDFKGAFCGSCNPAFVDLGFKIGAENYFKFYEAFGFHEKTGIDFLGEVNDVFFSQNGTMSPIQLATASIGQNFGITPLKMITAACVIANGGKLVTPHLVKEIRDNDGNIIKTFPTKVRRRVISEQTAKIVSSLLAENAISGGAKNAYIPGFRVAGKTGTSEKKEHILVPGEKDYISSFCGFAPADDPKIMLLTYCDTPKSGRYYGSQIAAPMFASAMSEILPYMHVTPKYTDEEIKQYCVVTPNLVGKSINNAKSESINVGLKPVIIGKGNKVISQIPNANVQTARDSSIILYTNDGSENDEKIKVPNFIGMKKSDARKVAESSGLSLSFSGDENGIVISQSTPESELVRKGSVINIVIKSE